MISFQKSFGISEQDIGEHCIICPADHSSLFGGDADTPRAKGLFFSVVTTPFATIISTRYNLLAGDCVLQLRDTGCKYLYLFGSCGGIGSMEIGRKLLVRKSYAFESFTGMLEFKDKQEVCYPDETLLDAFWSYTREKQVLSATAATVGSLLLEETYLSWFTKNNVSCVDMESSIVFSAAKHIKRKAIALLYVTDIIAKKPFYGPLSPDDRDTLNGAKGELAQVLRDFIHASSRSRY